MNVASAKSVLVVKIFSGCPPERSARFLGAKSKSLS
jgi:hypothetical protein